MKNFKVLITLCVTLALLGIGVPAQASESNDSLSITLEKTVQFEDSQGEEVLVPPGTYVVTAGKETLHLTANDSDTSITIEADENSHNANIPSPAAASFPGQEGPLAKLHTVILFLPNGHALQAIGTYPDIQSRGIPADTDLSGSTTTITFEKAVHFIAPDGSPVVAAPGSYTAEVAQDWIRLIPGEERQNALLVEAQKGTNDTGIEELVALSLPGSTEKELDLHFVMLLLPTGQTLEATGSYSGIQPRGFGGFIKKAGNKAKRTASRTYKKARGGAGKAASAVKKGASQAAQKSKQAALSAKRAAEHAARVAASATVKIAKAIAKKIPKFRRLSNSEKLLAKSVFGNTINYGMVIVTNTLGWDNKEWTTNTAPISILNLGSAYFSLVSGGRERPRNIPMPPIYFMNVGGAYSSFTSDQGLLIHELTHVWQGQHGVPFMADSAVHQTLAKIKGGKRDDAYGYTAGKRWGQYTVEQQAKIVEDWFNNGLKQTDARYSYIRGNILMNKAH